MVIVDIDVPTKVFFLMAEGSPVLCVLLYELLVDLCSFIVLLVYVFCHMVFPVVTHSAPSLLCVFATES